MYVGETVAVRGKGYRKLSNGGYRGLLWVSVGGGGEGGDKNGTVDQLTKADQSNWPIEYRFESDLSELIS
jgi:hypothetical protein